MNTLEPVHLTRWGQVSSFSFNNVALMETAQAIVRSIQPDDCRGPWCAVCLSEDAMSDGHYNAGDVKICVGCALAITAVADQGLTGAAAYWRGRPA